MKQPAYLMTTIFTFLLIALLSCADAPVVEQTPQKAETTQQNTKPPSSFQDTLVLTGKSAVFYEPDSLQLVKIKSLTSSAVFESSMHEYEYQFKNAKRLLGADWKDVKVLTAKNVRYLLFVLKPGKTEIIDLDKFNDAFGLFVFAPPRSPRPIEMTNAGSLVPDYFQGQ